MVIDNIRPLLFNLNLLLLPRRGFCIESLKILTCVGPCCLLTAHCSPVSHLFWTIFGTLHVLYFLVQIGHVKIESMDVFGAVFPPKKLGFRESNEKKRASGASGRKFWTFWSKKGMLKWKLATLSAPSFHQILCFRESNEPKRASRASARKFCTFWSKKGT